ncbi:SIR2 family protein [Nannocystis sp. RBIL2]|uniref:SIR2 family protein n=1 Tax=Nannocystis sp. RBIL2 TaxID=2996788 RepID=UPI002271E07E|nr:SIR2 family protein [Nannocystis sp. RBIL2]MCY1065607.1 SIR2 family protein [Nannocystis sp. RBIL2]
MNSSDRTEYLKRPAYNRWLDGRGPVIEIEDGTYTRSEVLFAVDRDGYHAKYAEYEDKRLGDLRDSGNACLDWRKSQRQRFERLVDAARRGAVVPFVGAGLTIPCGMKGWQSFLYHLADESLTDRAIIESHILAGEYEEAAELLCNNMGERWFSEQIVTEFGRVVESKGAVCLLPRLTKTCLITTNFDHVIESVFSDHKPSLERAIGSNAEEFHRALVQNRPYLLKVHGDVERAQDRVLSFTHYKAAYGDGAIDFARPLPKALKRAFTSKVLLFLGCSLGPDRTMRFFRTLIATDDPPDQHYAILEAPVADSDRVSREKTLAEHGIVPIWYPNGEHHHVEALVQVLVDRMEAQ